MDYDRLYCLKNSRQMVGNQLIIDYNSVTKFTHLNLIYQQCLVVVGFECKIMDTNWHVQIQYHYYIKIWYLRFAVS